MKKLWTLLGLLFLAGCSTTPTRPRPVEPPMPPIRKQPEIDNSQRILVSPPPLMEAVSARLVAEGGGGGGGGGTSAIPQHEGLLPEAEHTVKIVGSRKPGPFHAVMALEEVTTLYMSLETSTDLDKWNPVLVEVASTNAVTIIDWSRSQTRFYRLRPTDTNPLR